jgi:hypothetical protein
MKSGYGEPYWPELKGGYRIPYDPRPALGALAKNPMDKGAWDELWNELHHQGDVGEASYAAVPLLVDACRPGPRDWNFFGLVATIETERHRIRNPTLPEWISDDYRHALNDAKGLALADLAASTDRFVIRSALAVVALASGECELGALLNHADENEIREVLDDWLAWTELYRGPAR